MSYYHFEVTDFLEDEYFKAWVYTPTSETNHFWKEFLIQYPEKSEMIANAQSILLQIKDEIETEFPDEVKVENMLANIQQHMDKKPGKILSRWLTTFATAAAVLIFSISWFLKTEKQNNTTIYKKLTACSKTELKEKINSSDTLQLIVLPDRSTIVLHPKSSVSYAADFERNSKREVYLSGEAFFNVTKNPDKPFFVYANELITKVLGTSFLIKAFDNDKEVEVAVKTGKVSVFTRMDDDAEKNQSSNKLAGVILTPNQKVMFLRQQLRIKKLLVDTPEIIASAVLPAPMLKFQDEKVSQIFANLEQTYGIDIVYDEKILGNCLLTASFSNENLYEKIDMICKGIEAKFEVIDAQVVITGRGCH
ncbi:FecR family protein [Dyadobacter subterraneus]|uniref:FecR family protein n=1 Tax=Dyadobacter subterraneus TaxID=2773304 RepID=A0ABR9W6I8_9BACT|nr:FecR family protein [Dyadobacter subterraneus]MBE9461072.1 FecR family protein [Dyadobacter subterraneus]